MRQPDLSDDESVGLACALGEVGGGRARELLTVLQERITDLPAAVAQEIDIALQRPVIRLSRRPLPYSRKVLVRGPSIE